MVLCDTAFFMLPIATPMDYFLKAAALMKPSSFQIFDLPLAARHLRTTKYLLFLFMEPELG